MNRCPKCDNDRFMVGKKGDLVLEDMEITNPDNGEVRSVKAVKCSWCNGLMPFEVEFDEGKVVEGKRA